ncbi:MAG: hypothetical protein PHW24_00705 [Candidatus Moranbacteria bacterium]|nr:hypothetical protein [Candidatus Moranbacteria bacterium]
MKKDYRMCYCEPVIHGLDGSMNTKESGGCCENYVRSILKQEMERVILHKAFDVVNAKIAAGEDIEKPSGVHVPAYIVLEIIEKMLEDGEIVVVD